MWSRFTLSSLISSAAGGASASTSFLLVVATDLRRQPDGNTWCATTGRSVTLGSAFILVELSKLDIPFKLRAYLLLFLFFVRDTALPSTVHQS
jgi:hypothetical protein